MVAYEDVRFPDLSDAWANHVNRPTVVQRMDPTTDAGECTTIAGPCSVETAPPAMATTYHARRAGDVAPVVGSEGNESLEEFAAMTIAIRIWIQLRSMDIERRDKGNEAGEVKR